MSETVANDVSNSEKSVQREAEGKQEVVNLALFALGYFVLSRASLVFVFRPQGLASIWPPSGLALGILLSRDRREWPIYSIAIFATNAIANFAGGNSGLVSLGFAIGNLLEAVCGAWVFARIAGERPTFTRLRQVFALFFVATVVNAATALVGAAVPAIAFGAPYWDVWLIWGISDGLGMLLVGSFFVAWVTGDHILKEASSYRPKEMALMMGLLIGVGWFIFGMKLLDDSLLQESYFVFPLLVWIALRCGQRGTTTAMLVLAIVIITGFSQGMGPFVQLEKVFQRQVLSLQLFLGIVWLMTMVLTALWNERKEVERALGESERLLRKIAENYPHSYISIIERNYTIGFTSGLEFKHQNIDPRQFVGLTLEQVFGEQTTTIRSHYERGFQGEECSCELSFKDKFLFFHIVPLHAEDGSIPRILVVVENVTERKQTERELLRLERLRAVGELSAGVSHNLNNILSGVLLPAQMLRMRNPDPADLEEIDAIINAGQRASDLAHRLHLSVRGIEEDSLEEVDVNQTIREVMQGTRPRWKDETEARNSIIDVITELEEVPSIKGTKSRLHDMLTNLVFNAVDAMPEGGRIAVKTALVGECVQLIFSDTGIGMDAETAKRIFEPFFTTKMEKGTGLGLSTVYNTVVQWGGEIQVESSSGHGTVFTLRFPLWDQAIPSLPEGKVEHERRSGKLLIVDDDDGVRQALCRLLGPLHRVNAYASAGEALEQFVPGAYDALFTDQGMADLAGDQLAHRLLGLDPGLVTVLITGWELPPDDPRRKPFDFFIQKPFDDLQEIEDIVCRAIELHEERMGEGR